MSAAPSAQAVARFRDVIAARLGLDFDESRLGNLAKLLAARCGDDCTGYLDGLAAGLQSLDELSRLTPELTVTETYFFRNADQLAAYAEVALPDRLQAGEGRPVRILSAGCASGEEPYTLAMTGCERAGLAAQQLTITALDINPAMLAKAARGRYTAWSLRECSAALKNRYFRQDGDAFVLDEAVRRMVRFEARNLADPGPDFWRPASFDIVFCRNVLMYFTPAQMRAAIARIAHALAPGGYLFMGHAETLRGVSNDFHLCHTNNTFYYQRKTGPASRPAAGDAQARDVQTAPFDAPAGDTAWVEAIERAAERIHALTGGGADAPPVAKRPHTGMPAPGPDLQRARAYLHSERYDRTLEHLGGLDQAHADDPDVLLLKAVSLTHSGALAAAEIVCRQLLALDELNAGAHYVMALCREGAADVQGALEHNRSAAYLDPQFAMPRLHIGLLERRHGERDAARRDLAEAMTLLQKEEAARLLLFGGGFQRDALIALCRAELAALGASA